MAEEKKYLHIPGHVPIKEAALILGVSPDSVQLYIKQNKLSAEKIDGRYMIPEKSIRDFQSNPPGRRRIKPTNWRSYSAGVKVRVLHIEVQTIPGKQEAVKKRLLSASQEQQYLFPGTMQRYISASLEDPDTIFIQLIWKDTELTDEAALQNDLEAFKAEFADLLDWQNARYVPLLTIVHT